MSDYDKKLFARINNVNHFNFTPTEDAYLNEVYDLRTIDDNIKTGEKAKRERPSVLKKVLKLEAEIKTADKAASKPSKTASKPASKPGKAASKPSKPASKAVRKHR